MAEALHEVRRQIGAGAVILHTRQYKKGGFLGLGAKQVVEVTAADGQQLGRQNRSRARARTGGGASSGRAARSARAGASSASRSPEPESDQPTGDLIRRTYAAARAELAGQQPAAEAAPSASQGSSAATVAPAPGGDSQQLAREMEAVKRMVGQVMRQQQQGGASYHASSDQLQQQYLALLEQEVTQELAGEIIDRVHSQLSEADRRDASACREAVQRALAEWVPTAAHPDRLEPTGDGRPRTIALVGPTGVGKTTTIAKLAATFKIKQGYSVGLVTLDTYRIAAVEQLRTYAGIIGLELEVASNASELQRALQRCQGCDVVLIDTAGRSQRNEHRLSELAHCLEAAEPHEVHLVLSSTCSEAVLEQTIERFSAIRTDRIIFTKLDEAVTFGVVLNVAKRVNKQLSYITTGQEVPHQIEPGRGQRLAGLLLGEGELSA